VLFTFILHYTTQLKKVKEKSAYFLDIRFKMEGHVGAAPTFSVWKTDFLADRRKTHKMAGKNGIAPLCSAFQAVALLLCYIPNVNLYTL
jgi:hypothetical protein